MLHLDSTACPNPVERLDADLLKLYFEAGLIPEFDENSGESRQYWNVVCFPIHLKLLWQYINIWTTFELYI